MDELTLAIAEASAWLRALNRDRSGEDVAARLEAAAPQQRELADTLTTSHPGFRDTWAKMAAPVVEPEPEPE